MKFLSTILLMTLLILTISCMDEDDYIKIEEEQNFSNQQKINNRINKNDSVIIERDTIHVLTDIVPCIG